MNMSHHQMHVGKTFTIFLSLILVSIAIPTSVLQDLMSNDVSNKKVKRAQTLTPPEAEKSAELQKEFFYPTAIKRSGGNLKTNQLPLLSEWDQQRYREQAEGLPPSLYSSLDDLDEKSLSQYEKGYRYATNRDKLNEALENAILKSEIYGEPPALNQYRYYGYEDRKRKRRNASTGKSAAKTQKARRMIHRMKRETELTPEEILAIFTLWENERLQNPNRHSWQSNYENSPAAANNDYDVSDADEEWLDGPVYPHASEDRMMPSPNYYYDASAGKGAPYYEKRGRWGGFTDSRRKRFMVAKKRTDPTHELRHLNGPSRSDYYTLSDLMTNQRDVDAPVAYQQRYML